MRAFLLCAGFGTRLLPLTRDRAKPLLPVAGIPIVERLIASLAEGPVDRVTLVTNQRFYQEFLQWKESRSGRLLELELEVLNDGVRSVEERLGAVGDLLMAFRRVGSEGPAVVAAGDNLFHMDFDALWADVSKATGSVIVVHEETELSRLRRTGVAEIDGDGRVLRVVEKPEKPPSAWACPALYVLTEEALGLVESYVEQSSRADNLGEFLGWLVGKAPVFAHRMIGQRWDVGNLDSYDRAEAWLQARRQESGRLAGQNDP